MTDYELRLELMQKRMEHGFSQAELAKKLGVSQRSISMWENGESVPKNITRIKIAVLFGLPREYFLSDSQESSDIDTNNEETEIKDALNKIMDYYNGDVDKVISIIKKF